MYTVQVWGGGGGVGGGVQGEGAADSILGSRSSGQTGP
jgi:hypothetical protein